MSDDDEGQPSRMVETPRPATKMRAIAPQPQPPPTGKRVIAPQLACGRIPEYVAVGRARCDLCEKAGLRFGYHAEPNIDLCMDCYHVFTHESTIEVASFMIRAKVNPATTKFVAFVPK